MLIERWFIRTDPTVVLHRNVLGWFIAGSCFGETMGYHRNMVRVTVCLQWTVKPESNSVIPFVVF